MDIYTYTDFIQPIEKLASKLNALNRHWYRTVQKWEKAKRRRISPKQRKVLCDTFINSSLSELNDYSNTIHDIVNYIHQAEIFLPDNQLVRLKDIIGDESWQDFLALDCFWNDNGHCQ